MSANGFVDWSNPAILNSVSEFQNEQTQGMVNYNGGNDLYVPNLCHVDSSVPERKPMEEEVQSGARTQSQSGLFQGFSNSVDPFGFRYPVQPVGYGFGQ